MNKYTVTDLYTQSITGKNKSHLFIYVLLLITHMQREMSKFRESMQKEGLVSK